MVGRHFYAFHPAMGESDELVHLVKAYQQALEPLGTFDLIPASWLHLTMHGVGFVDEIQDDKLTQIIDNVQRRLASVEPFTLTFSTPAVRPEVVYLPARPAEPMLQLRSHVQAAIGDVLGATTQDAKTPNYRPHVSVAYSNTAQPVKPVVEALSGVEAQPVSVRIERLPLLTFHRDRRMYEWTNSKPLQLGSHAPK